MIYLDNASTTQVSNHVFDAMRPYFMEKYGNPGNLHSMGIEAASAVEKARARVAKPIHADPSEIIFTSGGSEANSLAITGLLNHLSETGRTHIVTSNVEHGSVLAATKYAIHKGFEVTYVPVNPETGCVEPQAVIDAMRDYTGLVSIMCVNNEIGTTNPIEEIGLIAHKHGALFHTDCVQAYCHKEIDVNKSYIDFLSASGHKIHAPKGIGMLYAKNRHLLSPLISGSASQEYGLRGGTENVPYIVGFGAAAEEAYANIKQFDIRTSGCRTRLLFDIASNLDGVKSNIPKPNSNIVSLRFDGVDGETLLLMLNSRGVYVSAGSACSAHEAKPSHVLKAIGLTDDEARRTVRVSFSIMTKTEDVAEAARIIVDSVKILRGDVE